MIYTSLPINYQLRKDIIISYEDLSYLPRKKTPKEPKQDKVPKQKKENEFTDKLVEEKWTYGITFTGTFVNERTINYITKYITKIDEVHKEFQGKILCSAGVGANYVNRGDAYKHTYKKGETIETCS